MEENLRLHVIRVETFFYGLSLTDLRMAAFESANVNEISHSFNKNREMTGTD